jgi:hypothetical protein
MHQGTRVRTSWVAAVCSGSADARRRAPRPAIIALIALNRAHRSSALMSLMICRASSERRRPCCGRNATCGPAIGRSNTRTTWFLGRHVLALKLDPVSEPKLSGATPAPAWIPANLRRLLSGERCVRSSSLTSRHHGAPRISRFFSATAIANCGNLRPQGVGFQQAYRCAISLCCSQHIVAPGDGWGITVLP